MIASTVAGSNSCSRGRLFTPLKEGKMPQSSIMVSPLYVSIKQERPTSVPPPSGRTRNVLNSAAALAAASAPRFDIVRNGYTTTMLLLPSPSYYRR